MLKIQQHCEFNEELQCIYFGDNYHENDDRVTL